MTLPLGYTGTGPPVKAECPATTDSRVVCKLNKSLYGLKQAPRKWFEKLSEALLQFGFSQSRADYTLLTQYKSGSFTAVLVYVDDMVITGTHLDIISALKAYLCSRFHMKDLGQLSYFLGLEVLYSPQCLFLCQKKYTKDLLAETKMEHCRPLRVPLTPNLKLYAHSGTPLADPNRFRRLVGKLIYLSITRPDISFAVQFLSQFMSSPTDAHLREVTHLLHYLHATSDHGLFFAHNSVFQLRAFCDSDWGSCPNSRKPI